jgi:hypothetical protein
VLGVLLLGTAVIVVHWPLVVAVPAALLAGWVGVAMLARAYELRRERQTRAEGRSSRPVNEQ